MPWPPPAVPQPPPRRARQGAGLLSFLLEITLQCTAPCCTQTTPRAFWRCRWAVAGDTAVGPGGAGPTELGTGSCCSQSRLHQSPDGAQWMGFLSETERLCAVNTVWVLACPRSCPRPTSRPALVPSSPGLSGVSRYHSGSRDFPSEAECCSPQVCVGRFLPAQPSPRAPDPCGLRGF